MVELSNDKLSVRVSEKGAELQSIKDVNGKEYLWQADPKYWPRHSPILFPIVCSVNDETYRVDGKEYHLPRHGFARDMDFQLIAQSDRKVTFALESSEETKKVYPYDFTLSISYVLDDNKVGVIWHVQNTDKQEIHFQIGAHPAFNAPGIREGGMLKGRIRVDNEAQLEGLKSYIDGSHDMTEIVVNSDKGIIAYDDEFFANDSVKLHKCQTHQAQLLNEAGEPEVTVCYNTPVVAFWSPYQKNAPFVCIEPWYGIGDPRGFKGEFKDKPLMNHLLPGASFMSKYDIIIG